MTSYKTVTCLKCGWVAFEVSRTFAEAEVASFNEYFSALSADVREGMYGGKPATLALYEKCFFCGGSYQHFRDAQEGDCPRGCTLSPIIRRTE
jgi:hypothetical protein